MKIARQDSLLRMLLTHRKLLQSKAIAVENDLRATLRNFGLKVGVVGTVKFEARIKELVENLSDVAVQSSRLGVSSLPVQCESVLVAMHQPRWFSFHPFFGPS